MAGVSPKEIPRQTFKQHFSENTGHRVDLENPKPKAESEISEELLLNCFICSNSLTHFTYKYFTVTFIGSISYGAGKKKKAEGKERHNTRTRDLLSF